MGGDARFEYPRYVWSPSGGWWPNPRNWRTNTAIVAVVAAVVCVPLFLASAERERRPIAPTHHIPSQRWAKHAAEDDPSLKSKH
eukprot:m.32683 g.32683  ORF g.32683 m.32683 type:complete len:84 (+) comp10918_c0_seq1:44-295(+)